MTNYDADYIWKRLPFAQGLQYQTAFYEMKGIRCIHISQSERFRPSALETIIE